jgi:hypothetical protein
MFKHRVKGESRTNPQTMTIAESRVLYVPIPKAANTSVRRALCPCLHLSIDSVQDVHKDERLPIKPWSEVASQISENSYLFTVVRNPYTRILSAYRDKVVRMNAKLISLQAMGIERTDNFDTFLTACARWPRKMLNDHFIPQSDLLAGPSATGILEYVKCEDLPAVWSQVADRIEAAGCPRPAQPLHENRNSFSACPEFSPKHVSIIQRLYREDFERFGYSIKPPENPTKTREGSRRTATL